jgi:hypothetical protein
MTVTIRAHFDGKVIIPDEPADLPVGRPLSVSVNVTDAQPAESTLAEQQAAYDALMERVRTRPVPTLPVDATRRESIYEDRM